MASHAFWNPLNPLQDQQRIVDDLHAPCAAREPGLAKRILKAL
jgi:hypothetical protein